MRQVKRLNKLEQQEVVYDVSDGIEKYIIEKTKDCWVCLPQTETKRLQNTIHATIQMLYGMEASDRLPKATEQRLIAEVRNVLQLRSRFNETFKAALIQQSRIREEFKNGRITFDGEKILNPKP